MNPLYNSSIPSLFKLLTNYSENNNSNIHIEKEIKYKIEKINILNKKIALSFKNICSSKNETIFQSNESFKIKKFK